MEELYLGSNRLVLLPADSVHKMQENLKVSDRQIHFPAWTFELLRGPLRSGIPSGRLHTIALTGVVYQVLMYQRVLAITLLPT